MELLQEIYLHFLDDSKTSWTFPSDKIFRQKFLDTDIPIMKGSEDKFVRKAYFGGATDYYKAYGTDLKYYDVNSLYPFAMFRNTTNAFKFIKSY